MPVLRIPMGADPLNPPPGVVVEDKGKKLKWRVRSLRDVFIAERGYKFVSADLAQIENRLIAVESKDPVLLKLFRKWDCADCGQTGETSEPLHQCPSCGAAEGKRDKTKPEQPAVKGFCLGMDIHSMTAHSIGLVEKIGFAEGRQRAKAINHAYNYGMGAATLARRESMSRKEAQGHLDNMDRTYANVRSVLHPKVKMAVRNDGVVVMFDGHKRRFLAPRLLMNSDNFRQWEREAVIREAVNVLAQGGTGIIMKRAMVAIRRRLKEQAKEDPRYADVHLVNQVHDELLYEAPEEIADDVLALVIWEMEHAALELPVPVIAEGSTGVTWGAAH
jgi:DNA polymerase I-like protein with 3'-5' exonuclease and polymerase domains